MPVTKKRKKDPSTSTFHRLTIRNHVTKKTDEWILHSAKQKPVRVDQQRIVMRALYAIIPELTQVIEHEIFRVSNGMHVSYMCKARSVLRNLTDYGTKSDQTLAALRSGSMTVSAFVGATPQELWPEHWAPFRVEDRTDNSALKYESMVSCACGSHNVFNYQLQTRCADEAMTTFYNCQECGRRWKS